MYATEKRFLRSSQNSQEKKTLLKRDFSIGDLLDSLEMFENTCFTENLRTAISVSGQILVSAKANSKGEYASFCLPYFRSIKTAWKVYLLLSKYNFKFEAKP